MWLQRDSDWGGPAVTVELFTDCVQLCTYDTACQFVQFDYRAQEGNCRLKVQSGMVDRCVFGPQLLTVHV